MEISEEDYDDGPMCPEYPICDKEFIAGNVQLKICSDKCGELSNRENRNEYQMWSKGKGHEATSKNPLSTK